MAILRAYHALNMERYDVRHDVRSIVSNEVVRFGGDADYIAYFGAIWHPDGWEPSGTLRAVSVVAASVQHFTILDLARPVRAPFLALQAEGDSRKFFGLTLDQDDLLSGSREADTLFGFAGEDLLRGGRGRDRLWGGAEDDVVRGGMGKDRLAGGRGDDRLVGGRGDDKLHGGQGRDVFVFSTNSGDDVIRDFKDGWDMIRIVSREPMDFEDLEIRRVGDHAQVVIDDDATVTLRHISPAELSEADFLFS